MSARRWIGLSVAVYAAIGLFTFGHSAALERHCWSRITDKPVPCEESRIALEAFPAAVFWPLWWSWEVQS